MRRAIVFLAFAVLTSLFTGGVAGADNSFKSAGSARALAKPTDVNLYQKAAAYGDFLGLGQYISQGQALYSGSYRLTVQTDGNLVIYWNNTAIWATMTNDGYKLMLQFDGNLVLQRSNGTAAWATNTWGQNVTKAAMQSDGNLVTYSYTTPKWWTGTMSSGYWPGHKPNGLYHYWYYEASGFPANYEQYMTWAASTLNWTDFYVQRVYSNTGVVPDVYIHRDSRPGNSNFAEVSCRSGYQTSAGICNAYDYWVNPIHNHPDKEALFCHEFGHTVGLAEVDGGDWNMSYLPAEKSCPRGGPDYRYYGARHTAMINAQY